MAGILFHIHKHRGMVLLIAAALFLASCSVDLFDYSAQNATGGNGAGLSGYQLTPAP